MIDLRNLARTGLSLARFFFRSPKDVAVENVTASGIALGLKIISLVEFRRFEDDAETLLKTFGWGVSRDPVTKHITTLEQPAGTWVMTPGGHLAWKPSQ